MGRKKAETDQLTTDSTNAIKAGLSYGKYIALYGHSKVKQPHQAPVGYKHNCQHCGKEFYVPDRRLQKFCSDICRERSYYVIKNGPPGEQTCPLCGKIFLPKSRHNKYCSEVCSGVVRANRGKAFRASGRWSIHLLCLFFPKCG